MSTSDGSSHGNGDVTTGTNLVIDSTVLTRVTSETSDVTT